MSQNVNFVEQAFGALEYFIPFLFALCFHEFAHGWVARRRGDRTAEIMGRLTMNPVAHADMVGTVILPLASFWFHIPLLGWAKPVPVNERNLKNPRVDMFWIAFAGPLSNLLLALIGAIGLGLYARFFGADLANLEPGAVEIRKVFNIFITVNAFLAVLNMLPVHPLDGAKVLARFLPQRMNDQLEAWSNYTSLILMMLFMSGGISVIAAPAMWIHEVLLNIARGVAVT